MIENPFTAIEKRLDYLESILLRIEEQIPHKGSSKSSSDLMTVAEAAAYLNVSTATIYSKTHTKEIPHFKRGKRLYFSKEALATWVREGYQRTQAEVETDASVFMRVSQRKAS